MTDINPCPFCGGSMPAVGTVLYTSAPTNDRDAYEGCREDLLDWKNRALQAEAELSALKAGQGEPFAYSMSAENAAKYPAMLAAPKAPIDLHTQGIYAVLDAEGVPVTGTMAASGYSARAQFVREMNMFWSKAVEQGYRVVALAAIRGNIDT